MEQGPRKFALGLRGASKFALEPQEGKIGKQGPLLQRNS